jgi:hypothetical protein
LNKIISIKLKGSVQLTIDSGAFEQVATILNIIVGGTVTPANADATADADVDAEVGAAEATEVDLLGVIL